MSKLFVSIRDLDDPQKSILSSADPQVVEGVGRLIADRLRQRVVEKLGESAGRVIDLARAKAEARRPKAESEED